MARVANPVGESVSPTMRDEMTPQQLRASGWFEELRDSICASFEAIETDYAMQRSGEAGRFSRSAWQRDGGGGGVMSVMRGQVFEKVGVNISTVYGEFSESFRNEIPGADEDPRFWASGLSLVAHMASPRVPAIHMNTRMICTRKQWFGGGIDLNPTIANVNEPEVAFFHGQLKAMCDQHHPEYYPRYAERCEEYFWLKHREEPRGAGGIFYDYLDSGDWEADFAFTQDVGRCFVETFPAIVRRRMMDSWSDAERKEQLQKRGRYVEFNLLYDRGTRFGLMTGGNTEAILMSLPPIATW